MSHRRHLLITAAAAAAASLVLPSTSAFAQAYPSKTITVVVSFPPGGDTDALARVFAEKLSARVGQPVVVENRPAASGTIGNSYAAKATPDGYTTLFPPNPTAPHPWSSNPAPAPSTTP